MFFYIFLSLLSLILILISCEFFTNSIEWTGKKFNLNEGVTGSILAAVGTALPETIIPVIALIFIPGKKGEEIGIGAILGAPFMLSTLAFGITGIAAIFYYFTRKRSLWLSVNTRILSNDIIFFIVVYILAISVSFLSGEIKKFLGIIFILIYLIYIYITFSHEKVENEIELNPLYFGKNKEPGIFLILLQNIVSLLGIVIGAKFFVSCIENLSNHLNVSPFIFSLFVAPIATELPEKFNSIIWIGKQKDTLALGNISGAMVFQSSIVVAVGLLGTNWVLNDRAKISAAIAILASLVVVMFMKIFKKLHAFVLFFCIIFYIAYIAAILNFVK